MSVRVFTPEQARKLAVSVLSTAGASDDIAAIVADHVTESDLMGVASHGLIRLAKYVDQINSGYIDPRAQVSVLDDRPGLVRLDGGGGFGIVALHDAARRVVKKAKDSAIAAAAVVNCAHAGRLGAYVEVAARDGCFAMVFGGGAYRKLPTVVPYGGRKGVFDTNPYALALPGGDGEPVVTDFATSATAQGKVLVYRSGKKPVPEGWLVDSDGNPTCDPEAYYTGGAMLPAAGPKGYGLAVVAELIGDALLGQPHEFNWMIIALDLWAIRPQRDYMRAAAEFLETVKDCPPAEGFTEVMLPGEPERRLYESRLRDGIPMPESTWTLIRETAERLNISLDDILAD
jgi:LDH2 family malate/lactate/ureidoglycolate dehydrogenase